MRRHRRSSDLRKSTFHLGGQRALGFVVGEGRRSRKRNCALTAAPLHLSFRTPFFQLLKLNWYFAELALRQRVDMRVWRSSLDHGARAK
jgi:hypothetical protein